MVSPRAPARGYCCSLGSSDKCQGKKGLWGPQRTGTIQVTSFTVPLERALFHRRLQNLSRARLNQTIHVTVTHQKHSDAASLSHLPLPQEHTRPPLGQRPRHRTGWAAGWHWCLAGIWKGGREHGCQIPPIPDLRAWTKERRGGKKFPKTAHRSVGHRFLFWNSGYSPLSSEGFNIQNLRLKLQLLGNSDISFSTNNFIFLYLCVTWLCVHCLLVSSNTKNQKLTFSSHSLNATHRHSAGTREVPPLGSGHWPSC